jgi:hypothetical protein
MKKSMTRKRKKKEKGIRNEDRSAQADFSVWPVSPRLVLSDAANVKFGGLGIRPSLWEHIDMAIKRTKADLAQRKADQLEKKSERRPEQETSKKAVRKDSSRAA